MSEKMISTLKGLSNTLSFTVKKGGRALQFIVRCDDKEFRQDLSNLVQEGDFSTVANMITSHNPGIGFTPSVMGAPFFVYIARTNENAVKAMNVFDTIEGFKELYPPELREENIYSLSGSLKSLLNKK